MKKLLFSLLFVLVFLPIAGFAQTATLEELRDFSTKPSTNTQEKTISPELQTLLNQITTDQADSIKNTYSDTSKIRQLYPGINEEDEAFLTFKEGQTLENYLKAITAENARRTALGQTNLLPNPTTQINPNVQPTPKQEPFKPQDLSDPFGDKNNKSRTSTDLSSGSDILNQIVPSNLFGGQPINKLLNQLFYIGLVVAVLLAIVMIIRGGVEYMTIDAIASKENGKNRIKAAMGGLLLAFSAILILNTINPGLTSLSLKFEQLKQIKGVTIGGITSGARPGAGTILPTGERYGSWEEYAAEDWVNGLPNGVRSIDGRLVVSTYSATGDAITDSNTAARRGNANNLLREGSVALSPDLIARYRPQVGQEVFINGLSVGFYEDTTASEYNGVQFRNTVDIYDENKTLGSKLKNVPSGEWDISFGDKRAQISNP